MVANGSGIQKETVRNIALAWVLTLAGVRVARCGTIRRGAVLRIARARRALSDRRRVERWWPTFH